jgi:SAM-dependent methyltransferase
MADDISDIAAYYDREQEMEHGRLDRHQLEHDITLRYLDSHLPSNGSILEIGAATGRYTLELARRGYAITAVDLSEKLLERCGQRLAEHGLAKQVRLVVADARDLTTVMKRGFDAVLMMGPLYHLVEEEDRKTALKEAYDRLRIEGLVFSSFISRFGAMGDVMKNIPEWIEQRTEVRSIIERGRHPEDHQKGGFRGYFATASEVAPLHEGIGFETVTLAGVEPAISADDESYNRLKGDQRQRWLDLLFEVSREPSTLGASRHLLYIGRKKG